MVELDYFLTSELAKKNKKSDTVDAYKQPETPRPIGERLVDFCF